MERELSAPWLNPHIWEHLPPGTSFPGALPHAVLAGGISSCSTGYSQARSGLVEQWQHILDDPSIKDVQFVLRDGETIWADSLILKVASPVLKSTLTDEMTGKDFASIHLDSFSAVELRFFLRLLYTGRMDPADWPVDEPNYEHEQLPTLPGSLVSQPPATTEPVLPLDGRHNFSGPQLVPAQGMMVGMLVKGRGKSKGKSKAHAPRAPPVSMLMSATALAKKYQTDWLLHVLVDVVKRRISEVSFEHVLSAAIFHDIAPVRLSALDFAQKSPEVWRRYELGEYAPEVLYELQAAFLAPDLARGETITI